jgi:hypothetical protein
MKKTLSLAVIAAVFAAPAFAANLENPLYIPKTGEYYSKTGAGVMYKKDDNTAALQNNGMAHHSEWPIYRLTEDLGYGITDRLSAIAGLGWTQNNDIDRAGLHNGRVGLNYRVFDGSTTDGIIWDLYSDLHLGGVMPMKGSYSLTKGFKYDNYTNGRWGVYAGTKVGKTWDKFTMMGFFEFEQTFGNHNNEIDTTPAQDQANAMITAMGGPAVVAAACGGGNAAACQLLGISGLTDNLSVNLKSTLEWNTGLKAFYELSDAWSMGGGFTYRHRGDNGIKSIHTAQNNAISTAVANALAAGMYDMNDGWDEYAISANISHMFTDSVQGTLYAEYVFDDANFMSQNGTDVKAEAGVRVNVAF